MRYPSLIETVHEALASACLRDLPPIKYIPRISGMAGGADYSNSDPAPTEKERRPLSDECDVIVFNQQWASTATGYDGGIGGSATTNAYTVIVRHAGTSCIYFGYGRLAYSVDHNSISVAGAKTFQDDLNSRQMASVKNSVKYK